MPFTRRTFCAAGGGAALAFAAPFVPAMAQTAKYRLRYGTAFPADHPGVVRIVEAAEAIKKETNGQVDLQVFPSSQLGSEPDMFTQTRDGALDFMSTSGANQTLVPAGSINAVAFAFPAYSDVWAAMDGDLGNYVRAGFAKVGLFAFPKCLDNGYRNITSGDRQVHAPADLKGFKIRVPGAQLWVTMFKALGAAPTPIDFGQLYAALQTRVVDGEENPLTLIQSAKLYEVQKYISMTGHIWDGHYIFAGAKRWAALPDDVRASIGRNFADAAIKERADVGKLNDQAMAEMKKAGVVFFDVDKKPFREALKTAGFYNEWKGRFGTEAWANL